MKCTFFDKTLVFIDEIHYFSLSIAKSRDLNFLLLIMKMKTNS